MVQVTRTQKLQAPTSNLQFPNRSPRHGGFNKRSADATVRQFTKTPVHAADGGVKRVASPLLFLNPPDVLGRFDAWCLLFLWSLDVGGWSFFMKLAVRPGFEPRQKPPKGLVLPLHHRTKPTQATVPKAQAQREIATTCPNH